MTSRHTSVSSAERPMLSQKQLLISPNGLTSVAVEIAVKNRGRPALKILTRTTGKTQASEMRSTEDLPAYSSIEVAKHASPNDAWLIVGGKVLDVTSWLSEHPGGDDVLLDLAGRDATREFEDVGHSSDARSRLDHLVIGTLRPATDAELRISRSLGGGSGKPAGSAYENAEVLRAWLNEKTQTLRQVGMIGAISAGIIVSAIIIRRYAVGWTSQGNR